MLLVAGPAALVLSLPAATLRPRPAAAAASEPIRLRIGTIAPENTPWADALREIKERIERESGGRIRVTLYLGGIRGAESEMLTEVLRGKLHAAGLSNGTIATLVPAFQVLELPFLLRTPEEADHVIDRVIGPELERLALDKGLYLALWSENGWRSIATRSRPVRHPDDVRGLKVRAQESPVNVSFWKALGAEPVRIPLDEVLSALQTGVVEGYDQTPVYMTAAGWHTQIRYLTLTRHIYQPAALVFSRRYLDSLPEELRAIVLARSRQVTLQSRAAIRQANRELIEVLAAEGAQIIEPSPEALEAFEARSAPVYEELREAIGGEVIDRVRAALAEFRARQAPGAQ